MVEEVKTVVCGQPYRVLASLVLELHWRRGDVGGRECLSKTIFKNVKDEVERREKILGWVTRGGECEDGVGVGVALEVGSA